MATQIQFRRGTASQWTTNNPILAIGELGLETDTGQFKIGNGVNTWSGLSYGGLVGPAQTNSIQDFGDGSDGDVVISASVVTLTRDVFYNNLTLSGTGKIITNGYRIFVKDTLDITAAGSGAIQWMGSPGGNGTLQTGGAIGAAQVVQILGPGGSGTAGATGVTGVGAIAAAPTAQTPANGGASQTSGAGGSGTAGAGGATRAGATVSASAFIRYYEPRQLRGATLLVGGAGGPGGGSGAGDGAAVLGRGGGAGGNGGGVIFIGAKTINRSGSTAAGAIKATGGLGGDGATAIAGVTGSGGGGGGSGGGGGFIYLAYQSLAGSTATNCINAGGGAGGNGGSGFGTGTGGNGGGGGNGGNLLILQTLTQVGTLINGSTGTIGNAAVGISGGTGGAAGTCNSSL